MGRLTFKLHILVRATTPFIDARPFIRVTLITFAAAFAFSETPVEAPPLPPYLALS